MLERKQSTTITVNIGPFLDATDGVTEETGLDGAMVVSISKNGAAFAARNSSTAIAHDADGWYRVELDGTDTDTLGTLQLKVMLPATHLPVWHEYSIVTANYFDSKYGADTFDVTLADGDHGGTSAKLTLERLIVASTTTNEPAVKLNGDGTAAGLLTTGGATGAGLACAGGATSGSGLITSGLNGDSHGLEVNGSGFGSGLKATGGPTGNGILASGGSTSGEGIQASGTGGSSGLFCQGSVNNAGILAVGSGTGAGLLARGGTTGPGLHGQGGSTSGSGILADGTNGTNDIGFECKGLGTEPGFKATGGVTGPGMSLVGGATSGDALAASVTSGNHLDANILAEIESECKDALEAMHLDHLLLNAVTDEVVDDTIIADIMSKTGDFSTFDKTTDSLEAIRDRGDGAWITGAGGSLVSGTSDSGTTTTMVDAARTEGDNGYWRGDLIKFTSGNISGQVRLITGFTAASDTVTFSPATTQAVGTNTYEIIAAADINRAILCDTTTVVTNDVGITAAAVNEIWDEVITKAAHNIANSAARLLREIHNTLDFIEGTAQAGTSTTITLASGESANDDAFNERKITIFGGMGSGQTRLIIDYDGTTKVATVHRAWITDPDVTSEYAIGTSAAVNVVSIGAGGTVLNTSAADNLETACDNFSAERGLSGTALPAVAADAAGGLPISDAGELPMDDIPLAADTLAELAQQAPPAAPTQREAQMLIYQYIRNRRNQTATEIDMFADNATTVIAKSTISDDGTTAEKGEFVTGP